MRSLATIKQEMIDDILALRNDVRLVEGDAAHDLVITAPANQIYKLEVINEVENRTRNFEGFRNLIADDGFKETIASVLGFKQDGTAYTTDDVDDAISDRLTAYVADWGVTRSPGSKSTTTVYVYLSDASPISWDNSTEFTSLSGSTYNPTTTVSNVVPAFDTSVGLYYVTIPVESASTGSDTAAVAGAITAMSPRPTNFNYCTNPSAATGGADAESDLDLIARAEDVWAARVNGSEGAYERLAEAEDYVDDALAMTEDDVDDEVYIGSVCDVVTQFTGEDTELVEEDVYWPGDADNTSAEQFDFTLSKQPLVTSFTPIVFRYTTGGVESQLTSSDAAISIVQDASTFKGSTKANDKLRINMIHDTGTYQRRLKVLYVYDKSPYKLQAVFDDSEERMAGPAVLVKKAISVPVRVIAELQIAFGYTESDVQTTVINNITAFFNGGTTSYGKQFARKQIGEDINQSSIADIILRTEGVVSYDRDTFFVINTLTGDLSDPVVTKVNEYTTLLDVLFEYNTYNLSNFTASSQGI